MLQAKSVLLLALTVLSVLVSIRCMHLQNEKQHVMPLDFSCKKTPGEPLPQPPAAFSYNVRVNFPNEEKTTEIRHSKDEAGKRESLEIFAPGRHVKYIVNGKQQLLVTFFDDDFSSCKVTSSPIIKLEEVDSGTNGILQNVFELSQKPKEFSLIDSGVEAGVFVKIWEGCFKKPALNISFSYSEISWKNPGAETEKQILPVKMEASSGSYYIVGLVNNAQLSMPPDTDFQPPEDVYCKGFREDVKIPDVPNFFSYDAELVMFSTKEEIAPFVLHRSVYYDYFSNLSRIDFQDIEPETQDNTDQTKFKATSNFVIHDYSSKLVYLTTYPTYRCELLDFEVTEGVVEEKNTNETPMLTGKQYFGLDTPKISYNGQFMTRGYLADVYTASVKHLDGTNGASIYSWYFTTVGTEVVEHEKAEKNVLLRIVFHPESGDKRRDRVEQNIYNFDKRQPNAQKFDITGCYDEKLSKLYVITFPANNALRGSEKLLKVTMHSMLMDHTGLSRQRIYVTQVAFNDEFMFAEFKLLESPAALKTSPTKVKEASITEAADKLRKAVKDGTFQVSATTDDGVITVTPLADGFNEFAGDRKENDPNSYHTGSVVGLTIGMLLLGFVLGGVVINLVISRKFGVSLFQKRKGGQGKFNTLNESSM